MGPTLKGLLSKTSSDKRDYLSELDVGSSRSVLGPRRGIVQTTTGGGATISSSSMLKKKKENQKIA